jgi:hypothetical protein
MSGAAVAYARRLESDWNPPKTVASFGLDAGDKSRTVFMEAVFECRQRSEIDMGAVLVAEFLAGMLDRNLKNEQGLFPTHRFIASSITKNSGGSYSTSWVCRKLRQLRAAGLIDWCHRFLPRKGEVKPTSNVYALTLPTWFVTAVKARRKLQRDKRKAEKAEASQAAMESPKARMNAHPNASHLNAIYMTSYSLEDALADLDPDDEESRQLMAERFLLRYEQLE